MRKQVDPRHHQFFELAYEAYTSQYLQVPHWNGKDAKQLSTLLKTDSFLNGAEFVLRYEQFLNSRDDFHIRQGGSLAYFCANFDKFISPQQSEAEPEFMQVLEKAKRGR